MSKYTTELRFICETYAGLTESKGFNSVSDIIDKSVDKIFDFNYPIFDEDYRGVLERKIIKHYYTREISEETVGLWKLRLDDKMNLIMPYYNELYKSALLEFNPFHDVDLTTEHNITGENKSDKNGTIHDETTDEATSLNVVHEESEFNSHGDTHDEEDNTRWDKYSDTPQGSIRDLENDEYLTNARKITDDINKDGVTNDNGTSSRDTNGETNASSTGEKDTTTTEKIEATNTEDYIQHIVGKRGGQTYSQMLKEFRETILNIDVMVINDLSKLFFGLW